MDLRTLQRRAWEIAEEKGHHDALRQSLRPDARFSALAELAYVYGSLTDLAQDIKRYGIPPENVLFDLVSTVQASIQQWRDHTLAGMLSKDPQWRTLVRLVLIHTEVDEAALVADQREKLAKELADIVIRAGELAEDSKINLTQAVVRVMEQNLERPQHYGTPQEE